MGDRGPISITVSIGVSGLKEDVDTNDDLVEHAISALHAARAKKGNFVSVFFHHPVGAPTS